MSCGLKEKAFIVHFSWKLLRSYFVVVVVVIYSTCAYLLLGPCWALLSSFTTWQPWLQRYNILLQERKGWGGMNCMQGKNGGRVEQQKSLTPSKEGQKHFFLSKKKIFQEEKRRARCVEWWAEILSRMLPFRNKNCPFWGEGGGLNFLTSLLFHSLIVIFLSTFQLG